MALFDGAGVWQCVTGRLLLHRNPFLVRGVWPSGKLSPDLLKCAYLERIVAIDWVLSQLNRVENRKLEQRSNVGDLIVEQIELPYLWKLSQWAQVRDLKVERIARAMAMSPRTLSRWCRSHLGESPAEVVRRLRVEEAARHLSSSALPLKAIAARAGSGDASTLWRLFMRQYGVPPDEYRQRFSSALAR